MGEPARKIEDFQESVIKPKISQDILPSIVVFLVALPLCMGIAIASGVPPAAGLITGIIGGIVVGLLSGAPLQVSGPAAGLSVLVWDIVQRFGLDGLAVITCLAGVIQIAGAVFRSGGLFKLVPESVVHGMLGGIGVLIFASQMHVLFDAGPLGSGISNLLGIPGRVGNAVTGWGVDLVAAFVGIGTIALIILWNNFKPRFLSSIPGVLVGVVGASLAVGFLSLPIRLVDLPESLIKSVTLPTLEVWGPLVSSPAIWLSALAIALIASAESLLCAAAVDKLHGGPKTKFNKELGAQGVGNALCGLLGALPLTGVIVRSAANIESGAKTRWSAVFHGLWLLLLVAAFPILLELIPMAALAGVLVFTGIKLVNIATIKKLWNQGKHHAGIYFVTLLTIVFTDLLIGVGVGLVLAISIIPIRRLKLIQQKTY